MASLFQASPRERCGPEGLSNKKSAALTPVVSAQSPSDSQDGPTLYMASWAQHETLLFLKPLSPHLYPICPDA